MNCLLIKKFFVFLLVLSTFISVSEAQNLKKNPWGAPERRLSGRSVNHKREVKIKEPPSVIKAKKKQEAKEKRLKKDYAAYVRESQKHAIEIQTPEVQARMKENRKDADYRYKVKKKKVSENTKKAGNKYRKY